MSFRRALVAIAAYFGLITACAAPTEQAQPQIAPATTTYLGNEGLMVSDGFGKVMFDPLFPMGFGVYQTVPEDMHAAIMAAEAPYDSVDAILVSHMHPDHFDVNDIITYLETHSDTRLFVPTQAADWMKQETDPDNPIFDQVTAIPLEYGDAPLTLTVGQTKIDVVRIPHAGWPDRADVSNLVYRVTLPGGDTVMHMGDADPDDTHFAKHPDHWPITRTDTAYPPYWFFLYEAGAGILENRINADRSVGIHVPMELPPELLADGHPHLHIPGDQDQVSGHAHTHDDPE